MNASINMTELLGVEQMGNCCFEQIKDPRLMENIGSQDNLYELAQSDPEVFDEDLVRQINVLIERRTDPGSFEWVDGLLLRALRNGWWIIMDNANLCPLAVLDRLNPLCEPSSTLTLNERGIVDDEIETIVPHANFRMCFTGNPRFGEISRAMKNCSIEIFLPGYVDKGKDSLFIHECRAIIGSGEFIGECNHQDLIQLSEWNLISYALFIQQTQIAQFDEDLV
jgi:midasin